MAKFKPSQGTLVSKILSSGLEVDVKAVPGLTGATSGAQAGIGTPANPLVLFTLPIGANMLGKNGMIIIFIIIDYVSVTTGTYNVDFYMDGVKIPALSLTTVAANPPRHIYLVFQNQNSTSSQYVTMRDEGAGNLPQLNIATTTSFDMTVAHVLTVKAAVSASV